MTEDTDVTGAALKAALDDPMQDVGVALEAPAKTWRLVIGSVEFWALVGGVSAIVTAATAVAAVFIGLGQLKIARDLQVMDSTYQSWNALNQATLANPELACPNTDEKFRRLMTTADPRSVNGGTYQDRYTAYGYMMITTFEQILQMAPHDRRWEFLIQERVRCNAPAIRALMAEGTYEKRYSCRLRRVIAQALNQPQPICREDDE
ncbi:MAG TPA: hypothetical protein VG939_20030 [Caulobacteraceae bacterium]|nr:hypothetical protein [Caulobacteraceae bacterium]